MRSQAEEGPIRDFSPTVSCEELELDEEEKEIDEATGDFCYTELDLVISIMNLEPLSFEYHVDWEVEISDDGWSPSVIDISCSTSGEYVDIPSGSSGSSYDNELELILYQGNEITSQWQPDIELEVVTHEVFVSPPHFVVDPDIVAETRTVERSIVVESLLPEVPVEQAIPVVDHTEIP